MFEEYKNDFVSTCKDGSRLVAAKEKWILKQREECSKISPSGIKHTKHDKVLTASLKMEIFIQLLELTDSKNKGIYECNDQLLEVEEFTQVIDNHKKLYVYDYENRLQPFRDSLSFLC
ncbi:MAG: hypothetical protein KAQ93_02725, partial [Spirochaetales bacterium]|nr:hypothetical protein [Spirochaetales bacterium]